ncbi:septum formation initiator family protein [Streptomyces sp. NPDC059785]|uniref:septum formation initiator family protein n=1 Tax=unclassified Streptomyces TaxID=2593676 RepID=UPI0036652CD7
MASKPQLRGRAARLARLFPAQRGQAARTPFVLLVVVLLGGGLIGLLVLNSALSEGSFQLDDLQKGTKNLTDEEQELQRDVDSYSAPDALRERARELGMVPGGDPAFLNPDGTVEGSPGPAAEKSSALTTVVPPEMLAPAPGLPAVPPAISPTPLVPPGQVPPAGTPAAPSAAASPTAWPATPAPFAQPTQPALPAQPPTDPGR